MRNKWSIHLKGDTPLVSHLKGDTPLVSHLKGDTPLVSHLKAVSKSTCNLCGVLEYQL
jgi:hypothetical protein